MKKRTPRGHYEPTDHPGLEKMSNALLVSLRDDIHQELGAISTTCRYLQRKGEHITAILRSRNDPPLKVSDHAVIRYLEKVKGQNLDGIRAEITNLAVLAKNGLGIVCRGKGDAIEVSREGLSFIITHDYVVATVYPTGTNELAGRSGAA